jgi:hypothetical protein
MENFNFEESDNQRSFDDIADLVIADPYGFPTTMRVYEYVNTILSHEDANEEDFELLVVTLTKLGVADEEIVRLAGMYGVEPEY